MINSNCHPISYRFGVIAAYCSNLPTLWLKILRRRGRPPPIIFAPIVRPMNALQICPWQFSHMCYSSGATSENISKFGDFTQTRSLWSQLSGTRGRPPPIIFARLVRPMNALQLCRRQFSHSYYGWGATSENRSKIGNLAPTRSLWSQLSGKRGRLPPIIFAQLVRPMNVLQLCRWQFSHKETL